MSHDNPVVTVGNQQIAIVPYTYMPAAEVAAMQQEVRDEASWVSMVWGNLGPKGTSPLELKTLSDCDTDHLEAILITQPQLSPRRKATILELLKRRYKEQDNEER